VEDTSVWWVALALGAVVLVVVAALLAFLYRQVCAIESGVTPLVGAGEGVVANTAKIRDLLTTAAVLNQIKAEAVVHDDYLSRQ